MTVRPGLHTRQRGSWAGVLLALVVCVCVSGSSTQSTFVLEETTVASVQEALRRGTLTCRSLVDQYLARIDAFDKRAASLNAIVEINPQARDVADALDRQFAQGGPVGPLHCVPVIAKDNFETVDMPTTGGSLALAGMQTGKDAFVVRRLRAAGAVFIAKSNMAEFAFSPVETVSSILPGYTRNPYDIRRVTAGSSGGSAAATAANFAVFALASDTGDSIRGPASHQALVGLRSTMGLVSRAGVVPLNLSADIAGVVTRTVADTAVALQVIAGEDPDDPATLASRGHVDPAYTAALGPDGLRGARLGVLHEAYDTPTTDPEIRQVFARELDVLRHEGAVVVDPAAVPTFAEIQQMPSGPCNQFKYDLNRYLAGLGNRAPMSSLEAIIKSGRFHPSIQVRLQNAQTADHEPGVTDGCRARDRYRARLRAAVLTLMDEQQLDALVYPTWSNVPRMIGDLNTPAGDNNQLFAPSTGFPAISVPMGYTRGNTLPAGLQFFGRPWNEAVLLRLAYAYEQATHHRRPPVLTP